MKVEEKKKVEEEKPKVEVEEKKVEEKKVEQPKVEEKKVEEEKVEESKVEEKKVENAWKRAPAAPKVEVEKKVENAWKRAPAAPKVEVEQPKAEKKQVRVCRSIEMGQPCPHGHKCRFAHPTSPTPTPPPITRQKASLQPVDAETETVLRVPKELAMQAMQMAMQSGKSNIRIEIV